MKNKQMIWVLIILLVTFSFIGCSLKEEPQISEDPVSMTTEDDEDEDENLPIGYIDGESEETMEDVLGRSGVIRSYSYEMVQTMDGQPLLNYKLWIDGFMMKYEDDMQIMIIDNNAGVVTMVTKADGSAYTMAMESGMDSTITTPFELTGDVTPDDFAGMVRLPNETVDGKDCAVYTSNVPGMNATYYIWEDLGVLIQMTAQASGQPETNVLFKDLNVGGVTGKDFELPEGIKPIDMGNMPTMPEMPVTE